MCFIDLFQVRELAKINAAKIRKAVKEEHQNQIQKLANEVKVRAYNQCILLQSVVLNPNVVNPKKTVIRTEMARNRPSSIKSIFLIKCESFY